MNSIIKNYEIHHRLGEGGMGTVYYAVDIQLHREVALKCLRPEVANNPGVMERFRKEAQAQARLNHPNIAQIWEFFQVGSEHYMAMEFVDGPTLARVVREKGRLPFEEAGAYAIQALRGLDHAHKQGIVHRDIKPANLMIHRGSQVKVTDFGIARVRGASRDTRAGMIIGTYEYISPEAAQGLETTAVSDLYSMGVVLFEMITGRLPFESQSEYELLRMHIQASRPSVRSIVRNVPGAIDDIVQRAMDRKTVKRFRSAEEMADGLQRCLDSGQRRTPPSGIKRFFSLGGETELNKTTPATAVVERRRADVSSTCHRVEDLIEQHLFNDAGSVLEAGFRSYPDEPDFIDLRNRLQRQWQQHEQAIVQQTDLIQDLLKRGFPEEALKVLGNAQTMYPRAAALIDLQRECRRLVDLANVVAGELAQIQDRVDELITAGQFQEATDYVLELLRAHENQIELNKLLARILQARKDAEKQVAIRECMSEADEAANAGEWESALAILDGGLGRFPEDLKLLSLRQVLNDRWHAELRRLAVKAVITEVRDLEISTSLRAARERLTKDFDRLGRDQVLVHELERIDAAIEVARRDASIGRAVSAAADLQGERKWAEALDLLDRTASREGRDTRIDELRATVAAELRTHEAQVARAATDARQRIQDFQWEEAVLHLSTAVRELPGEQILDDLMQEAQRGLAQKRRDAATPVYARPPATSPETASELQPRIAAARARAVEARRKVRIAELEHKIGESIGAGLLEKAETELQGAEREFPGEASFATWREVLAEERRRIAREAVIRDANDQAQRLLEQARTLINDERYLGALALLEPAATRFPEIGAFSSMLAEVREGAAVEREVRRLDAAEQEIRSLMAEQKYEEALKEADEGLNEYPGEQVFQDLRALIAVSIEEQAAVVAVAEKVHRLVAAGKGTEADRALLEALRRYPGRMKLEKMRSEVDAARKAEWDRQSREAGLRREVSEIEKLLGEGRLAEASTAAAELENKHGKEAALEVAQRIGAAVAQAERQRLAAERNLAKPEFELHTNIVSVSDKTSEERYAESTQRMPVHSSAPLGEESISALAPSSEPRALPPTKLQRPPSLGSTPASPVRPPLDPWQPHWVFKAIELAEKAPGGTAATPGPSAKDREIEPPLFGEVPPAAATFEDRESTPASTHGGRKLVTWALVVCALIAIGLVGALWLNSVQDDTAVSKPMKVVPPTTPTDLEVQRFRGLIANGQSEFTKGNYDAALAWFEEAQRIEPGNREARDAVADLVSAKKAKEDLGTKDALNRAERAFKNGSYDEAIQVCLQVLSHDPNNNRAKQRLARARAASEAEKRAFGRK